MGLALVMSGAALLPVTLQQPCASPWSPCQFAQAVMGDLVVGLLPAPPPAATPTTVPNAPTTPPSLSFAWGSRVGCLGAVNERSWCF